MCVVLKAVRARVLRNANIVLVGVDDTFDCDVLLVAFDVPLGVLEQLLLSASLQRCNNVMRALRDSVLDVR
jgi:hypothetical protein